MLKSGQDGGSQVYCHEREKETERVDQNEGERAIVSSILSQLEAERSESMDARVQVSSFGTIDDMIQYIRARNVVHDLVLMFRP